MRRQLPAATTSQLEYFDNRSEEKTTLFCSAVGSTLTALLVTLDSLYLSVTLLLANLILQTLSDLTSSGLALLAGWLIY